MPPAFNERAGATRAEFSGLAEIGGLAPHTTQRRRRKTSFDIERQSWCNVHSR